VQVSIGDVAVVADMTRRLGIGPVGLAGRMLGLTEVEQKTLPKWAWWSAGIVGALGLAIIVARAAASDS
jgi:hypothetical protein